MSNSITEVAALAGVSISTVSNVMTGKKAVSKELEKRVQAAIHQLGYTANPMASGLRSNRTNTIGVIITSFQRVFFGQVLKGIQDTVVNAGYMVCVFDSNNSLSNEKRYVKYFVNSMVDGVILLSLANGVDPEDEAYFKMLGSLGNKHKRIPVVGLERTLGSADVDAIMSDNRLAAYIVTQHLIVCGHKRIAHIAGPLTMEMCQLRLLGYQQAMKDAGLETSPKWIKKGNFSPISGYIEMGELIRQGDCTAVFAGNDPMAIGAIKAIKESGLRIPEDIAVAGFDNTFPSTLVSPSLTTINVPTYQLGVIAANRLIKRINGEIVGPGQKVILKTQLIVRQSTDVKGDHTWDLNSW